MRTRSHWGWGYADRFPDREARVGLGQLAAVTTGVTPGEPEDPVPLEAVALPAGRIAVPAALRAIVDDGAEARIRHTYGRAYPDLVRGFRGDFSAAPDIVGAPTNEAEVLRLLELAEREGLAVVPFGGGTSVVGGVECARSPRFAGVMSLDLGRLAGVYEVDDVSLAARVGAGTLGPDLSTALEPHGVSLRHYPQSFEHSTVGGWIATRAGGHFATGPTRIDAFVEALTLIAPSGRIETRRLPSSGAGPSPNALLVGSEGAFGVITEAWLKVLRPPARRARATVSFADFAAGARAVRAIVQSGLQPANCRLLDPDEVVLHQVAAEPATLLLLGFEASDADVEGPMQDALRIAVREGGAVTRPTKIDERGSAGKWRDAFFDAPYLQTILVSLGIIADTFETATTWAGFPALDEAIREAARAAMRRVAGEGRIFRRFTHAYPDGPAPYYTFLAPARRGAELEQWAEIKRSVSDAIGRCGGTITHHHAVGRTHAPGYAREVPAGVLAALGAVKTSLDPAGRMNPGVLGLGQ